MRKLRNVVRLIPTWSAALLIASPLPAQAATYTVGWSRIAGGGGTGAGGQFSVTGTAGQPDAHAPRATGQFAVTGGFGAHLGAAAAPANRVPVAGADALVRLDSSVVAKGPLAALLANDSDPDGDGLSISGVSAALPAGATVVIAGTWAIYTVPVAGAGNGSFTYTLSDGAGGHSIAGSVTVAASAAPVPGFGPNAVAVVPVGADFLVHFLGVPGFTYRAQYSTDAGPPYTWREFAPPALRTAPAAGVFSHTDVAPPEAMRLYRAILNP